MVFKGLSLCGAGWGLTVEASGHSSFNQYPVAIPIYIQLHNLPEGSGGLSTISDSDFCLTYNPLSLHIYIYM